MGRDRVRDPDGNRTPAVDPRNINDDFRAQRDIADFAPMLQTGARIGSDVGTSGAFNLADSAAFDTAGGDYTQYWTSDYTSAVQTQAFVKTSTYSLKLTQNGGGFNHWTGTKHDVSPGDVLRASGWVYHTVNAASVRGTALMRINWRDSGGTLITSGVQSFLATLQKDAWTWFEVTDVAPANAATAEFFFESFVNNNATDFVYINDFRLQTGAQVIGTFSTKSDSGRGVHIAGDTLFFPSGKPTEPINKASGITAQWNEFLVGGLDQFGPKDYAQLLITGPSPDDGSAAPQIVLQSETTDGLVANHIDVFNAAIRANAGLNNTGGNSGVFGGFTPNANGVFQDAGSATVFTSPESIKTAVQVTFTGNWSTLSATATTCHVRCGISLDGGATYGFGQEVAVQCGNAAGALVNAPASVMCHSRGVPTGNIMVKLQCKVDANQPNYVFGNVAWYAWFMPNT